jgi:hypothetical protein
MCQTQPNRALQVVELDEEAIRTAEYTQEYAGYASYEGHATLQSYVVAIGAVVDQKMHQILSGVQLEEDPKAIIDIADRLIWTVTESLTIRTVAYPSALICISTAQKLIMLLDMIKMPNDYYKIINDDPVLATMSPTKKKEYISTSLSKD